MSCVPSLSGAERKAIINLIAKIDAFQTALAPVQGSCQYLIDSLTMLVTDGHLPDDVAERMDEFSGIMSGVQFTALSREIEKALQAVEATR